MGAKLSRPPPKSSSGPPEAVKDSSERPQEAVKSSSERPQEAVKGSSERNQGQSTSRKRLSLHLPRPATVLSHSRVPEAVLVAATPAVPRHHQLRARVEAAWGSIALGQDTLWDGDWSETVWEALASFGAGDLTIEELRRTVSSCLGADA